MAARGPMGLLLEERPAFSRDVMEEELGSLPYNIDNSGLSLAEVGRHAARSAVYAQKKGTMEAQKNAVQQSTAGHRYSAKGLQDKFRKNSWADMSLDEEIADPDMKVLVAKKIEEPFLVWDPIGQAQAEDTEPLEQPPISEHLLKNLAKCRPGKGPPNGGYPVSGSGEKWSWSTTASCDFDDLLEDYPAPLQARQIPMQQHRMPVQQHRMPVQQHQMPVQQHQMPVQQHQMPVQQRQMPVQQQQMPMQHQMVPVQQLIQMPQQIQSQQQHQQQGQVMFSAGMNFGMLPMVMHAVPVAFGGAFSNFNPMAFAARGVTQPASWDMSRVVQEEVEEEERWEEVQCWKTPETPGPAFGMTHRFHVKSSSMGMMSADRRSFTKNNSKGRLSIVCEDRVHHSGITRYAVQFVGGELSNADGVGFILSADIPCSKNIQKIVSVFANRTGRICVRMLEDVERCSATVKPIELGDWLEVISDLDKQVVTFVVWPQDLSPPSSASIAFGKLLNKVRQIGGCVPKKACGYLAIVIKNLGVSVALGS